MAVGIRSLTENQAAKAESLKCSGYGYKYIAAAVGAGRDQVRDYLRWRGYTNERNERYVKWK